MKPSFKNRFLASIALAFASFTAAISAQIVVSGETNNDTGFTVSSTDLLQTNLASTTDDISVNTGENAASGGSTSSLTDGTFGALGAGGGLAISGGSVTYYLDTPGASPGYDISQVNVYTGWNDDGRDGQNYTVSYSTVSAPTTFIDIATVTRDESGKLEKSSVTESTAPNLLATGVKAIRITFNGQENGAVGYKEIDVIGSTPVILPRNLTWNNGAVTDAWNTTDANWTGSTWDNARPDNAIFGSVGGTVNLGTITAGSVNVGNTGGNFTNVTFSGGSLSATSLTVQGFNNNGGNYGSNPTLSLDTDATISGDAAIGRANLTITSGTVTANRIISAPASADWARLVVSGGTVIATNGVDGSVNTGATFAIDLNGGELHTPSIRVADREAGPDNSAWLTFNGTTVKATGADNANFITLYGGGQNTYVASGGAIIDTNGRNIGIQVNLLNGGGGLTKDGAGTLTLSGTNTYSGATTVTTGTLEIGGSGGFDANTTGGQVTVDSGATIKISTSANNALAFQGSTPAWQVSGTLNITANNANSIPAAGIVLNNGTLTGTGTEITFGSLLAVNGSVNTITAYGASNAISNSNFGIFDGVTLTLDTPQASDALTASTAFFNANSGTTGGLAKTGDGTVTLTGANTYSGSTTVSGGILSLSTAFLADGSTVSILTGAALNLPHGLQDTVDKLFLEGFQVASGVWGGMSSSAPNKTPLITGSGTLDVLSNPPVSDPFLAWIDETWPTLSDKTPTGDPDNDGITNLVEYVLKDGDPSTSNPGILPTVNAAGTDFVFTYFRRAAATGTTQVFESSATLGAGSWTPVAIPGGPGVIVTDQGGGIDKVEITVPKGTNTKLFGRLQVTKP
jgi:autotransporter-associated beta strand protein